MPVSSLRWSGFGTVVGNRTPEARDQFRRYWDSSVDVPGPAVERLVEIAAENHQYMVVGVVERNGGTLYCTADEWVADPLPNGVSRRVVLCAPAPRRHSRPGVTSPAAALGK